MGILFLSGEEDVKDQVNRATKKNINSLVFPTIGDFMVNFLLSLLFPLFTSLSYSLPDSEGIPLDLKLVELLDFQGGVFVEVGANDGVTQSNTKLLEEKFGWTGILIEPSQVLFSQLSSNRPYSQCFQCALGSFEEDGTYAYGDFDGNLMSSLNGARLDRSPSEKVLIRSLQSILDEVNIHHIDLLNLDTEGHEMKILEGIDFSKTQFDYMLIEIYKDQYDQIVSFLSDHGYELLECFTNYNLLTNPNWDGTHNDYLFKRRVP